mmetsp:Transcript_66613/g.125997  ORF Transcript_66613/g.125997 Transcript_66613/m.125997 type:complete len:108 (-) Transcript_66613:246-569(-)
MTKLDGIFALKVIVPLVLQEVSGSLPSMRKTAARRSPSVQTRQLVRQMHAFIVLLPSKLRALQRCSLSRPSVQVLALRVPVVLTSIHLAYPGSNVHRDRLSHFTEAS